MYRKYKWAFTCSYYDLHLLEILDSWYNLLKTYRLRIKSYLLEKDRKRENRPFCLDIITVGFAWYFPCVERFIVPNLNHLHHIIQWSFMNLWTSCCHDWTQNTRAFSKPNGKTVIYGILKLNNPLFLFSFIGQSCVHMVENILNTTIPYK